MQRHAQLGVCTCRRSSRGALVPGRSTLTLGGLATQQLSTRRADGGSRAVAKDSVGSLMTLATMTDPVPSAAALFDVRQWALLIC